MVNLLKAKTLRRASRQQKRRQAVLKAIGMVVVLVAALGMIALPFVLAGRQAISHANDGREALEQAERSVGVFDLTSAENEARKAANHFSLSRGELTKFGWMMNLPYLGDRLASADRLLKAGQLSAQAVSQAAGIGREVMSAVGESGIPLPGQMVPSGGLSQMTKEDRRRVLESLARSGPEMRETVEKITLAMAALDNLPSDPWIMPYRDKLEAARDKLEATAVTVNAILPAVEALPRVLGYPNPQKYLFFFQNNNEMRPTGGFLGLVGQMTVDTAALSNIEVHDTYAYDASSIESERLPAPAPLQKYVGVKQWYLRDANWSPDFTAAAARMENFFLAEALIRDGEAAGPFNGVIAVTPNLAQDILRMTGPVTVDGVTFDADNLVDRLEFEVEMAFGDKGISREDRKVIVGSLMEAVLEKVKAFSLPQLLELVKVVQHNLAEGHILLNSNNPRLQELILKYDWGGQLRPVRGDYFTVVDANLASLKSDSAVDRDISYTLKPDGEGNYEGRLAITYTHNGGFDWKTTRYRTYTRVYLPAGSKLLGVSGALENDKLKDPGGTPGTADSGTELGRAWFGAFTSIEPGTSGTLEFRFRISKAVLASIMAGSYRLTAERQSGTPAYGLTLDLDFGKNLTAAVPAEPQENWGDTRYTVSTDLELDRYFEVNLRK